MALPYKGMHWLFCTHVSTEICSTLHHSAHIGSVCLQEAVPEALRKKAETASAQASALPSRAVSQDASLATGAAAVVAAAAAADGAQSEVASPPAAAMPDLAAAEGGVAAAAVTEALPTPQPALQATQAAEPTQTHTAAADEAPEPDSAAAAAPAEDRMTMGAANEPQPGDPAAGSRLDAPHGALQAADVAATPGARLGLDKQLLGARSRSDPVDGSKGAPLVGKEAPSASAPLGDSGSLHEGGASLQEAEQANGKVLPPPQVQEAAQPAIMPGKTAAGDAASLQNGAPEEGEAAAPAKPSRPAAKRMRRS